MRVSPRRLPPYTHISEHRQQYPSRSSRAIKNNPISLLVINSIISMPNAIKKAASPISLNSFIPVPSIKQSLCYYMRQQPVSEQKYFHSFSSLSGKAIFTASSSSRPVSFLPVNLSTRSGNISSSLVMVF